MSFFKFDLRIKSSYKLWWLLIYLDDAVPFFRYWNGKDHFYTTNVNEIGTSVAGTRGHHGYISEGIQCKIYTVQVARTQPLYRYWNGMDHFYTQNPHEIGTTEAGVRGSHGYVSEGVAGYCFAKPEAGTIPLYRYYGNGEHFYTTNAAEIGTIVPDKVGHHGYNKHFE